MIAVTCLMNLSSILKKPIDILTVDRTRYALLVTCIISCFSIQAQDSIIIDPPGKKIPDQRFFLKGEIHEFPEQNGRSLLALLQYLHANNNVRYLVMECGPDQAFLANKYLETGDDSLLTKLYLAKTFWPGVNEFNRQLPNEKKIKVLGYDFNRYVYSSRAIGYIVKDKLTFADEKLNDAFKKILEWDTIEWNMNKQSLFNEDFDYLRELSKTNDAALQQSLGKYYNDFITIISNRSPATPNVKRDKKIVANLLEDLPLFHNGNFLFNYGIAHIFLDGVGAANILESNKEFKGQVCSIYPYYIFAEKSSRTLTEINKQLPVNLRTSMGNSPNHQLISLDERKIYPGFKKAQWVLVIRE